LRGKSVLEGQAIPALMGNYHKLKKHHSKEALYIFNNGRQKLHRNVVYSVLLANIEKLLNTPDNKAS
jgi:hypothetical protein